MVVGVDKKLDVDWFFFFQAEDGIRDYKVTGVQTCALPICPDKLIKTGKIAVRITALSSFMFFFYFVTIINQGWGKM